jgi:hypothetical protein
MIKRLINAAQVMVGEAVAHTAATPEPRSMVSPHAALWYEGEATRPQSWITRRGGENVVEGVAVAFWVGK